MAIRRINTVAIIAAAFVLAVGCEDQQQNASPGTGGGGSSGGGAGAVADEVQMLQRSSAGVDVVGETLKISSDTIVDDGTTGGATQAMSARGTKVSKEANPGTKITFQSQLDITLNLDDTAPNGEDAHPNASGVIHISAHGSVMGDEFQGQVAYDVTVTFQTDTTFTDPASGAQSTIGKGATLSFSIVIDWDKIDQENWTVAADAEASVTKLTVLVVDEGGSVTLELEAYRHDITTIGLDQGVFIATRSVEGFWDATFSNESETHNIRVDIINLGRIYVTIDGVENGPYSAWQLEELYDITLD